MTDHQSPTQDPPARKHTGRKVVVIAFATLGIVAGSVGLAGSIPNNWQCDLISHFRLVFALILSISLMVLLVMRSFVPAAIVAGLLIANSMPVLRIYTAGTAPEKTAPALSILNFNTEFQHNSNYKPFCDLVGERNPDLITLVEVDSKWIEALEPATAAYPYRKIELTGPGMAFYSKLPIESYEVDYFGKYHHPRMKLSLRCGKRLINAVIAHPTTPKSEFGYRERTTELALIADELASLNNPKLLIGDFNCSPWSPAFKVFSKADLRDSEDGYGPQPTWPARTGRLIEGLPIPPLVPIDHVLVSSGIFVLDRHVGPPVGSDHLPVFVTLGF
ncbi:MAG: endonuclease/exonuclease/phosphatase family protein [Cyanobacteria bacterium HKST-UBA02]|nr:endonuclease/exonuclease/phosphatase family protein [Cyanobacteria bacterium HKST-UBA02]